VSEKILDKKPFTNKMFVEFFLSSVTQGKDFAEYKIIFTECLGHSVKKASLIVNSA
jgi:hypothetical protein